jgi:hypothetical protein
MSRRALILALVVALPIADASARQVVDTLKPLLVEALKGGRAEGLLDNPDARAFTKTFGATAPIRVDVERVGSHAQPGCGRLEVTTRQAGVVERDEKGTALQAKDQRLVYQVNFCENGRFPVGEEGR